MRATFVLLVVFFLTISTAPGQPPASVATVDLSYNNDFRGFDMFDSEAARGFIIAEDVHNRDEVPAATLKFLRYLHTHKGITTLAIEGGASTAYLLNRYLETQDTTLLREIVRHTFYWSREHYRFIEAMAEWNQTLPPDKRIVVRSADIEIKQESVVLAMNVLMGERVVPPSLPLLESFRAIFKEKEKHKNRFQALNVLYYYDKDKCRNLASKVLKDLEGNAAAYRSFFAGDFNFFNTMMADLMLLYDFNYRRETRFKFRDEIIYNRLLQLHAESPQGFLYVVGAKHVRPGSSSFRLRHDAVSPLRDSVIFISTTGRMKNGKYSGSKAVTRISKANPQNFKAGFPVLMKNTGKAAQYFDYSLALLTNAHVRPFYNSYTGK